MCKRMRSLTAEQQSHKLSHGGPTPPASTTKGCIDFTVPWYMAGVLMEWLEWQKSAHDRVKISYRHGSILWLWSWFVVTVEGPELWVKAWIEATADKLYES